MYEERVGDPGVGSGKLLMLPVGTSPARLEARPDSSIHVVQYAVGGAEPGSHPVADAE